jgi:hypothetical protein
MNEFWHGTGRARVSEVVALRYPSHHPGLHRFFQGATWLWAGIFAVSTVGLAAGLAIEPASWATSGLRVGAVRPNKTHKARLPSGNWSKKSSTLPVASTAAACSVSTRAEIISRPGTLRVAA